MFNKTITAIATANGGNGGVGIIRISGDDAIAIANKIFKGVPLTTVESHKMHLGKIVLNNRIVDEVLVCVYKSPNSYTGEDVVEINCHGGVQVCRVVLGAVIESGATFAEAGEFTHRAFLNGKLDLTQAEAVADIINAQTNDAVTVAASQLSGTLSHRTSEIREQLLSTSAHLLATLDFSEEGVEDLPYDDLKETIMDAKRQITELLSTADDGRIIKDGVNVAIIGAPNVGKSSLLNAISGEDRAIVTDIAGTTRDVLEAHINIRGCKVNLLDTAGIRSSEDVVERLGVERSLNALDKADLVFLVLDGSRPLTNEDLEIIDLARDKNIICLINKCDLPQIKLEIPHFEHIIHVSATSGGGLDELFSIIASRYSRGELASNKPIITNERHKECLIRANGFLDNIISSMNHFAPVDLVLGDIELAIVTLGEISGMTVSDEIIDNIFSNFCVGK